MSVSEKSTLKDVLDDMTNELFINQNKRNIRRVDILRQDGEYRFTFNKKSQDCFLTKENFN